MDSEKKNKSIKYKLNYVPDTIKNLKSKFKVVKPKLNIMDSEINNSSLMNPSLTIPNKDIHHSIQHNSLEGGGFSMKFHPNLIFKSRNSLGQSKKQHGESMNYINTEYIHTNSNYNLSSVSIVHKTKNTFVIPSLESINKQQRVADRMKSSTISSNISIDSNHSREHSSSKSRHNLFISSNAENGSGKSSMIQLIPCKPKPNIPSIADSLTGDPDSKDGNVDDSGKKSHKKQLYIPKPKMPQSFANKDQTIQNKNRGIGKRIDTICSGQLDSVTLASSQQNRTPIDTTPMEYKRIFSLSKEKQTLSIVNKKDKCNTIKKLTIDQDDMLNLKKLYSNGKIDTTPSKATDSHIIKRDSFAFSKESQFEKKNAEKPSVSPSFDNSIPTDQVILSVHQKSISLQESLNGILNRTRRLLEMSFKLNQG